MSAKKLIEVICVCFLLWKSRGEAATRDVTTQNENLNVSGRSLDAGRLLTSIATRLMSRGYAGEGGSHVVSLNLTNLLVLVLLKALIFAAGSLGAGTWKGGYARSYDGEERIVTDEEMLLYLSYLAGIPGDNGCLQHVACKNPQEAKKYAAAGEMALEVSAIIYDKSNPLYESTLRDLRRALNAGLSGGDCNIFSCNEIPHSE